MKQALILVDIQNDYFPKGKFELCNTQGTVNNIKKVLDYFRSKSYPIIHIQHIALDDNAPFFIKDSIGCEIYTEVSPRNGEYIVQKNYPNSFFQTNLKEVLEKENIKDIVVCGMMTHMCIDSTVRGGSELGFNCTLIEDCCTTRDLTFGENTVKWNDVQASFMSALSSFSNIVKTNDFLE